jgi:hypothetical protein
MTEEWRSEWRGAVDFAEVAEALKVKTTQIVIAGYGIAKGAVIVFYSPDDTNHDRVVMVVLRRDNDGVLQQDSVPTEIPGFFQDIQTRVEKGLRDQLGEPNHEGDESDE